MNIGDLVCWYSKRSLIGIVLEVADRSQVYACKVQWANGVISNHSAVWLAVLETSENT